MRSFFIFAYLFDLKMNLKNINWNIWINRPVAKVKNIYTIHIKYENLTRFNDGEFKRLVGAP